ncbi:dihydroxyacetone kinase [Alkalihalobacillus alcalophilus ATCC 27647 = CGMCC 1.3604]|uniref:phosphoenolpyruvate--glycerone phosphotransferase n=1 Tax=Alkalihalobacillus alcalophilus ATCC 27647 = CGMCC 1.3604 TaxID=1218173 RepID=A0A094WQ55_ALKAL|nr:dihydroxyacetone kinase [Alkalihalobacillus alcalophilus ATCC 27647 = CGMCC 1.3604]MED1561986.1 dihydroxyacetone kinase phosphoryl donor subunit DhaM [Alkalihalobacillus alcalophilus]
MDRVSLVFVSHSYHIVKGLQALMTEMQPDVKIAIAGGEPGGGIGTNALDIKKAIESVYTEKGVVILFDLGSALMNSEMAIELLDDASNVCIADAPILEGGYAAVVEAGFGSEVEEVKEAAQMVRGIPKIPTS